MHSLIFHVFQFFSKTSGMIRLKRNPSIESQKEKYKGNTIAQFDLNHTFPLFESNSKKFKTLECDSTHTTHMIRIISCQVTRF